MAMNGGLFLCSYNGFAGAVLVIVSKRGRLGINVNWLWFVV